MELILDNPLTFYALLGVSLALCLYLFVSLKKEIHAGRARQETLEASLERVSSGLREVAAKLAETEERAALLVPPKQPRSGLNLSTRSQVLRMWRRGDAPQQIAAALGIPEREVELLLKVRRLVMEATAGPLPENGPVKNPATGGEPLHSLRAPLAAERSAPARA